MNNELVPKVYDIDYSFLIKNYLSPDLWDKTWTLFVYRNVKVTLEMYNIAVRRPIKLTFKLTIYEGNFDTYDLVTHDMENSNFEVLKKQINGAIRDLINCLEIHHIKQEDGYKQIERNIREEREILKDIASSYLDTNGITLEDVRDVYIDRYVSDNEKGNTYRYNYLDGRKYKNRPDVWLVYYNILGDETKINAIKNILIRDDRFENLLEEFKEYNLIMEADKDSEEYQDYINDMELALDGI